MLRPTPSRLTTPDADVFVKRTKEPRKVVRLRILSRQSQDGCQYNTYHGAVAYELGDQVWVWTPIRSRGRTEKLPSWYF